MELSVRTYARLLGTSTVIRNIRTAPATVSAVVRHSSSYLSAMLLGLDHLSLFRRVSN